MGKYSDFPRRKHDGYDSPASVIEPLSPFLPPSVRFAEPCVGWGDLVLALMNAGHRLTAAVDIEPRGFFDGLVPIDAVDATAAMLGHPCRIITNPPWTRRLLHVLIEVFRQIAPTWLLFDANWMNTIQAAPHLQYCRKIVSVGRVSWMENGAGGKEDASWFLFDRDPAPTEFVGRR
ncbi:MAG: class I SAM-dependent methyltransferase [Pseudomonadota bacterium]